MNLTEIEKSRQCRPSICVPGEFSPTVLLVLHLLGTVSATRLWNLLCSASCRRFHAVPRSRLNGLDVPVKIAQEACKAHI